MFFLYLIFFFLILRFTVTLFNFISNPKLTASGKHYNDLVSILIPSGNSDDDTLTLLQSISAQDYKMYEVILPKRISTNNSIGTWSEQDINHDRITYIDLPEQPDGWSEKDLIYFQLSKAAKGKYILFLDPRSIIANGLINNAVHRMKIQRLALLSLFSNQLMINFGERLVVPLINYLVLNLVPLRLVRLSANTVFSISSVQFMMFDAQAYVANKWNEAFRNKTDGGNEIMRLVKGSGHHAEALLANGYLYCRLYTGFATAVQGLSRSITANFGSITALFIYLFLVVLGPVAIAMFMGTELLLFALTLIVLSRIMISLASGQNPWLNVLLHPIQMFSLVLISVLSVQKHFTKSINRRSSKLRS